MSCESLGCIQSLSCWENSRHFQGNFTQISNPVSTFSEVTAGTNPLAAWKPMHEFVSQNSNVLDDIFSKTIILPRRESWLKILQQLQVFLTKYVFLWPLIIQVFSHSVTLPLTQALSDNIIKTYLYKLFQQKQGVAYTNKHVFPAGEKLTTVDLAWTGRVKCQTLPVFSSSNVYPYIK